MDQIFLQKQIRNNAQDLQDFYKEISEWGEEMKAKDEQLKTKQDKKDKKKLDANTSKKEKKEDTTEKKEKKRIRGFDYAAWDKFDVDAECAKLDKSEKEESDESDDLSDEFDENAREQSILEKEKGNKFVKMGKWDEAIKCYTQAIQHYGYDPIFYANRALCHLKKQNFKAAESDCTVALQLDKTYVKAYQRRAAARENLDQLNAAREDLLKVFDYEPNNKESKQALANIEKKLKINNNSKTTSSSSVEEKTQRPKSKFTLSRNENKQKPESVLKAEAVPQSEKPLIRESDSPRKSNKEINSLPQKRKDVDVFESRGVEEQDIEVVKPIYKPAHLRSKRPLKRIKIKDVTCDKKDKDFAEIKKEGKDEVRLPIDDNKTLICDNIKVVERKTNFDEIPKDNNKTDLSKEIRENILNVEKSNKRTFVVPRTSVQFTNDWKTIKNDPELRYQYLKQIKPKLLPDIFKDSLESDIFSGIIKTLEEEFINRKESVIHYLTALTYVKRFATLVMFMSSEDKKCLLSLMEYLKSDRNVSNADIDILTKKFEL